MSTVKSDKAAYDRITKKIKAGEVVVIVIAVNKTA